MPSDKRPVTEAISRRPQYRWRSTSRKVGGVRGSSGSSAGAGRGNGCGARAGAFVVWGTSRTCAWAIACLPLQGKSSCLAGPPARRARQGARRAGGGSGTGMNRWWHSPTGHEGCFNAASPAAVGSGIKSQHLVRHSPSPVRLTGSAARAASAAASTPRPLVRSATSRPEVAVTVSTASRVRPYGTARSGIPGPGATVMMVAPVTAPSVRRTRG